MMHLNHESKEALKRIVTILPISNFSQKVRRVKLKSVLFAVDASKEI